MNLSTVEPEQLKLIDSVVCELAADGRIAPDSIMLVGAECRDLLHRAHGHVSRLRGTSDIDVGLAIEDWGSHDEVLNGFSLSGSTGIRYRIAGIPVDVMPFGSIERPRGKVAPPRRLNSPFSVFAFQEVFDQALRLALPSGAIIRVPTRAGYAALKLRAWRDRWTAMNETKDGPDLAADVYWYSEDPEIETRLYNTAEGNSVLASVNFDVLLAAAQFVGRDAIALMGEARADELRPLWSLLDLDPLAKALGSANLPGWPTDRTRLRELAGALSEGVLQP